jgi:hypothetical protein
MWIRWCVANKNDADLIAGNIKDWEEIFGVDGSLVESTWWNSISWLSIKWVALNFNLEYDSYWTTRPIYWWHTYDDWTYIYWVIVRKWWNSGISNALNIVKINKSTWVANNYAVGTLWPTSSWGTRVSMTSFDYVRFWTNEIGIVYHWWRWKVVFNTVSNTFTTNVYGYYSATQTFTWIDFNWSSQTYNIFWWLYSIKYFEYPTNTNMAHHRAWVLL